MNIENFKFDKEVIELNDELIKNRRHFHRNPEPSLKEYKTSAYIKEQLDIYGIEWEPVGETGVLGIIKGGKKGEKTIFIRGDMDALEVEDKTEKEYTSQNKGLNHACGHDGHTAAMLGAAKLLNKRKSEFGGTVKLCFQQAEEIGAGARQFVKAGHLKDVNFAFGIHLASSIPVGEVALVKGVTYASCDMFEIKVKGEGAHASAPHLSKDAVTAVASIVLEIQNIISRQKNPVEPAVISIGRIEAGTRYNIIASNGTIKGTLRTISYETREKLLEKIEKVAKLAAEIHNCEIDFSNYDAAAPLINEEKSTEFVQEVAKKIIGEENLKTERELHLGGEDFADFLSVAPGCFANVGSSGGPETSFSHHHEYFDIDERALLVSTQLYINTVLEFLNK